MTSGGKVAAAARADAPAHTSGTPVTTLTIVSGSPNEASRTAALARRIADEVAGRLDAGGRRTRSRIREVSVSALSSLLAWSDSNGDARSVLDAITGCDLLVAATPVYKGSYSGLFKHLFDLLDPDALVGKPVLLAATGGGDRHALVIEHQLRPLFGFFRALTVPTGVYACERDFDGMRPSGERLHARIAEAAAQAAALLASHQQLQKSSFTARAALPIVAIPA